MSIKSLVLVLPVLTLMLSACNPSQHSSQNPSGADDENIKSHQEQVDQTLHFVGCYSIDKNLPSQIKISQKAGQFVMQMKEPENAKTLWDAPEPLDEIDIDKAWDYFKVNALSLEKSDVQSALARPDAMMVLVKVKEASQNINPLLDSPYVVYIFKGANTIYQVPCDDKPLDIIKEGEQTMKAFH